MREFVEAESFNIIKKTKKSEREVDLKPLVYEIRVDEVDGAPVFFLKVSTGSVDNIKPELVLASLYERCHLIYDENAIQIHRCEVYARDEQEQLIPLDAMGEEIIKRNTVPILWWTRIENCQIYSCMSHRMRHFWIIFMLVSSKKLCQTFRLLLSELQADRSAICRLAI